MNRKHPLYFVLVLLMGLSLAVITGCTKDDNPIVQQAAVDDDDIANSVAASMGSGESTNGFTAQIEKAALVAGGSGVGEASDSPLSPLFDTTFTRSGSGTGYSYNYRFHYFYTFTNLGNRLTFGYDMKGYHSTSKLTAADSATADVILGHIIDPADYYSVNGTYTRGGTTTSLAGAKTSFSIRQNLTLDSIAIAKATKRIRSGSATLTVSGSVSTGKTFSYTATVVFLGGGQARIAFNGKTWLINLAAGTAEKQ